MTVADATKGEWVAFFRHPEDRQLGMARLEAGQCPECGEPLDVVDGWARCPAVHPTTLGPGPLEFQFRQPGLYVLRRQRLAEEGAEAVSRQVDHDHAEAHDQG